MQSLCNEEEAACCDGELALRAYSSRLLGGDDSLVLHGGGNTSAQCAPESNSEASATATVLS